MTHQSPQSPMVHPFTLGPWQTNCYVTHPAGSKACWIIDAGFNPQPMIDAIRQRHLAPELIVLTHAHADHIAGLREVRDAFPDVPILIHEAEADFLTDAELNLSAGFGFPIVAPAADRLLHHGDTLSLADLTFEIRHTPGHSPGGICLHQPDHQLAFTGDTLFRDSIGRYDFPTSDPQALMRSIHEQLLTLPDETKIYPGHMQSTTIGRERRMNPYLQ
ncbi:MAG: MBL fold metallo-hydrolase [Planctomycetes bacterium]|nr:MBL fold metallo-hydrolase [Planctomycetota bacterium]